MCTHAVNYKRINKKNHIKSTHKSYILFSLSGVWGRGDGELREKWGEDMCIKVKMV